MTNDDGDDLSEFNKAAISQTMKKAYGIDVGMLLPKGVSTMSGGVPAGMQAGNLGGVQNLWLARIARGMGLPLQIFSGDLADTNYSASRWGDLESQATYSDVHRYLRTFVRRSVERWLDYWADMGDARIMAVDPVAVKYQMPHRDFVDPLKDVQRFKLLLDMRVITPEQVAAELGFNFMLGDTTDTDESEE